MNRKQRRLAGRAGALVEEHAATAATIAAAALEHHQEGRWAEADALYRQALRLAPDDADVHYNHGVVLMQQARPYDAIAAWRTAVKRRSAHGKALNNLGSALAELDQLAEAESVLRAALARCPGMPETHNNLAIVLWSGGRLEAALTQIRWALALQPDCADAQNTLGVVRQQQGRLLQAVAAYRVAITIAPDHAKAHFNLGLAQLALGHYAEGWREHEWRWRGGARRPMSVRFAAPIWQGEPLAGRTILLHAEQAFGDTVQFVRFATCVGERGGRVVLAVPKPLVRLCRTVPLVADVTASGEPLPPFDCHLPLLSVPHTIGVTLTSLPGPVPYLRPNDEAVARWHDRLGSLPGLKIGVVWSGEPRPSDGRAHAIDRRRSIPLARWLPVLRVGDASTVSFVSLQTGSPRHQLRVSTVTGRLRDVADHLDDFAETAAAIACLDLIISVDTAVAHLAGALAKPVWILSRFDGCWRWLLDRDDSPWYPTARLFRQAAPGAWEPVIDQVADALACLLT